MKRIVEANTGISPDRLSNSRRKAHGKTRRSLTAIDADDEGITGATDWIVDRIAADERPPDSRAVRRRAAKCCRETGYDTPKSG